MGWVRLQEPLKKIKLSIDYLLVQIHLIIEMMLVDRPCAMEVGVPFSRQSHTYLPIRSLRSSSLPRYMEIQNC